MNSDYTNPVNIGNPDEFTMLQLAELIRNKINPSLPIIHKELPEDDPMQRQPIITLAKEQLDWQPQIKLKSGLDHTINYFKEKLHDAC
jgi:UDP-glucuronate decarboxylase